MRTLAITLLGALSISMLMACSSSDDGGAAAPGGSAGKAGSGVGGAAGSGVGGAAGAGGSSVGKACELKEGSCPDGLFCLTEGKSCSGTCQPFPEEGGSCKDVAVCGPTMYCAAADHKCTKFLAEGQSGCASDNCASGLFCNPDKKCEKQKPVGAACSEEVGGACENGSMCSSLDKDGKDLGAAKCVKMPVVGESCENMECGDTFTTMCNAEQVCVALKKVGEACKDPLDCVPGANVPPMSSVDCVKNVCAVVCE